MKQILLSRGLYALVDDKDFEELNKYKWCALKAPRTFYAVRTIRLLDGKRATVYMHRQILEINDSKTLCDHRDGNGLNNQRHNIRACIHAENMRNKSMQYNNASGAKGVYFSKQHSKFMARIYVNGEYKFIGLYHTAPEAARAYDEAAKLYHGEFAWLNFP